MNAPIRLYDISSPDNGEVIDTMKWLITVMDRNDKGLPFVASVFSYALKTGGISEKQVEALERIYARIIERYELGTLAIQGGTTDEPESSASVTHLNFRKASK